MLLQLATMPLQLASPMPPFAPWPASLCPLACLLRTPPATDIREVAHRLAALHLLQEQRVLPEQRLGPLLGRVVRPRDCVATAEHQPRRAPAAGLRRRLLP